MYNIGKSYNLSGYNHYNKPFLHITFTPPIGTQSTMVGSLVTLHK